MKEGKKEKKKAKKIWWFKRIFYLCTPLLKIATQFLKRLARSKEMRVRKVRKNKKKPLKTFGSLVKTVTFATPNEKEIKGKKFLEKV